LGLRRGLNRRWFRIATTQQATQKTRRMGRWTGLLRLLLQLRNLRFGLFERDVLHQNRLRENVERIRVHTQRPVQQRFGVGIFFLQLRLVHPLDQRVQKLFFLGSQGPNLRRQPICTALPRLRIETPSRGQSCSAES
jgi:hypothetical protein